MIDLEEVEENRRFLLEEALAALGSDGSAEIRFDVAFHYRVLALCRLLGRADRASFATGLAKSALARLAFLRSPTATQADSRLRCISGDVGFENALAAGDLDTALEVAAHSPEKRLPDAEYLDDFLFRALQFALARTLIAHQQEDIGPILTEFERELEGQPPHRLTLIRALQDGNARDFENALGELVLRRQRRFEELRKTPGFPKEMLATEGAIFVQGLALLRLAELRGITIARELPMLPTVALVPVMTSPLSPQSWLHPDD